MSKSYKEMYEEAATRTDDQNGGYYYKGYTGGNALSLFVSDEYGVNASAIPSANSALVEVINNLKEK